MMVLRIFFQKKLKGVILSDYYAPSGPPIRPIESFNIQFESTGTQIESSKIAMPISA